MIDTDKIRQETDLMSIVAGDVKLRRVAGTGGGEFAGPCPFCGAGDDRFRVQPNHPAGGRWFNRGGGGARPGCTCGTNDGRWHDVIDYVMKRDGLDFRAAVATLTGEQLPQRRPPAPIRKPDPQLDEPPAVEWQSAALTAVYESADYLLHSGNDDALQAWNYLREYRGLEAETIKAATLGFNPAWREVAPGLWLAPGIVIPCLAGGDLWYVNVRTSKAARQRGRNLDKYHAMTGSRLAALYGANRLVESETGIIVEGEFDALLLQQHAPAGVAVATMGAAGARPSMRWRLYVAHLTSLFVCLDQDAAGERGAAAWQELVPFARPLPAGPAPGQDVTDFWRAGGDLAGWINGAVNV